MCAFMYELVCTHVFAFRRAIQAYLYERLFRLRAIAVLSVQQQNSEEQW